MIPRVVHKSKPQGIFCWGCRKYIPEEDMKARNYCISCYSNKKTRRSTYLDKSRKQVRFRDKVLSRSQCKHCGEKDVKLLQFDHIERSAKLYNISRMVKNRMSIEEIKEEMRKCQILCFKCHIEKTKIDMRKA